MMIKVMIKINILMMTTIVVMRANNSVEDITKGEDNGDHEDGWFYSVNVDINNNNNNNNNNNCLFSKKVYISVMDYLHIAMG